MTSFQFYHIKQGFSIFSNKKGSDKTLAQGFSTFSDLVT